MIVWSLIMCSTAGARDWTPAPVLNDTYWAGSAPLCVGGCRAQHQELRRDRCGGSSCCWFGYKTLCKGETTTAVVGPLKTQTAKGLSDPPVDGCAFPLHCSELWEARCRLQRRGVRKRLVGGLCGQVRLSLRFHAGGKPDPILQARWPLDSKTLLPP